MRGAYLAVVVALGLGIAVLSGFSRPLRAESPAKPFHAIQDDVRAALRRESQAKTFAQRSAAVCELVELHRALVTDSRFPNSETLHGYRNQVASRLLQVQADVKRQVRREQFSAAKAGPPKRDTPTPESVGRADELSDSLAEHLALVAATVGGPTRLLAVGDASSGRGGGAAGPPDNGPALVDLIQRTIHPDSWDVNGGLGSIVYFSPLRCLVVRATRDVHGEVSGLAQGLRDAAQ